MNAPRIAITTGGGDCPGLNAVIRAVTKAGMDKLGITALVSIGDDGSLSIARQMHEHGIPIVGVPRTIDNDLDGTLFTLASTPPPARRKTARHASAESEPWWRRRLANAAARRLASACSATSSSEDPHLFRPRAVFYVSQGPSRTLLFHISGFSAFIRNTCPKGP